MSATFYDDPNREAVGLEPIWTGAGDPPDPPEGDALELDDDKPKAKSTKK